MQSGSPTPTTRPPEGSPARRPERSPESRNDVSGQAAASNRPPPCPAPRFRSDLTIRPQQASSGVIYVVEDPLQTRYFRLGPREYLLLAACDGKSPLADAIRLANATTDDLPLTATEATAIVQWAANNDLLEREDSHRPSPPARRPPPNPLMLKIPLGNPGPLLRRLDPYLSWIHSWGAFTAGMILLGGGLLSLFTQGSELVASTGSIYSARGQLSLLVCWVVLKAVHELSHAVACRRYGATVRQAGVLFILLLPMAYVDVTSAWRLRSRWQRIHIAAAGMQLELYIAAAAVIAWPYLAPGLLQQTCAHVTLMAGLSTVLFNANPLMRFDGYYILADLLRLPNLAITADLWLRDWSRRTLLGLPAAPVALPARHATLIRVYAVAAFAWRILVCVGLIVAATLMWHGAGIVLAVAAAVMWFIVPVVKLLASVRQPGGPRLARIAATGAAGLALCMGIAWLPWPGACRLSGIVDYDPMIVLRTEVDGFVEEIAVRSGAMVEADEIIARLRNPVLARDLAIQGAKVEAARLRVRQLRRRRHLAALEAETRQLAALEEQLEELKRLSDALTIRAPHRGRVLTRNIQSLEGMYLEQGDVLVSLGNESGKQIVVAVPERRLDGFDLAHAGGATITLAAGARLTGGQWTLDPRATDRPMSAALCAPNGGTLSVREASEKEVGAGEAPQFRLLAPHFTGRIALTAAASGTIHAGERATVALRGSHATVGGWLQRQLRTWLEQRGVAW